MNSIDRFKTFWRLCIKSSDWWANENECSDSDGKRERSSVNVGEAGYEERDIECSRDVVAEVDLVKSPSDGFRLPESGMVGVRSA